MNRILMVILCAAVSLVVSIVVIQAWSYAVLPGLAQDKLNTAVKLHESLADVELLESALSAEENIQSILVKVEQSEEEVANIQQRIRLFAKMAETDLVAINVQSGNLSIDSNNMPALSAPNGCEANRGAIGQLVKFEQPFSAPPQVLASFSQLDFGDGTDHRLRIEVMDITELSFKVDFATWCDTKISQAKVSWIAIGL